MNNHIINNFYFILMDYEEEQLKKVILKRINTKDTNIRKLTLKYIDLINKFNQLTRGEMTIILDDLLNEIDLIEINTLKAENIQKLKIKENEIYNKKKEDITTKISDTKKEISNSKTELVEARNHKEYMIKCDELAKEINEYDEPKILTEKITQVKNENNNLIKYKQDLDNKFRIEEEKVGKILELISELKKSFPNNTINNNQSQNNVQNTKIIENRVVNSSDKNKNINDVSKNINEENNEHKKNDGKTKNEQTTNDKKTEKNDKVVNEQNDDKNK